MHWKKVQEGSYRGHGYDVFKGTFRTPCFGRIYDALPEESRSVVVCMGWSFKVGPPLTGHRLAGL